MGGSYHIRMYSDFTEVSGYADRKVVRVSGVLYCVVENRLCGGVEPSLVSNCNTDVDRADLYLDNATFRKVWMVLWSGYGKMVLCNEMLSLLGKLIR